MPRPKREKPGYVEPDIKDKTFIGIGEAAQILDFSESYVKRLARDGYIPGSYKIDGKHWILPRKVVLELANKPSK